jgi:hypothetical protein
MNTVAFSNVDGYKLGILVLVINNITFYSIIIILYDGFLRVLLFPLPIQLASTVRLSVL